jgi:hypothetical protein
MSQKDICKNVAPLMARKAQLMNTDDVKAYLDVEKKLAKAKKTDGLMFVAARESGEIPDNDVRVYDGTTAVHFREERPVATDKVSDALVIAIVENNTDAIRVLLTQEIIEDAILNATGRRSEGAKKLQGVNIENLLKPIKYTPVFGLPSKGVQRCPTSRASPRGSPRTSGTRRPAPSSRTSRTSRSAGAGPATGSAWR